jgi:hypothetical protein
MISFVNIAYAAESVDGLIANISKHIINPFIGFLFVLATVYFLGGIVRYYFAGNPTDRAKGHRHILGGLIGMFIMVSVFGIMQVIIGTFDINLGDFGTDTPSGLSR